MRTIVSPDIITTQPALADLVSELRRAGWFAFDTEFVGEDTYKPEVCLIQTATDDRQALIDPLAGLDTRPLWDMVVDPSVKIIVHAGTEDLALCQQQTGQPAANVIDLQIAAGMLGLGYPTSLLRIARTATGARLHKSQTLTDWRRRPLTGDQIDYATQDVMHLPAIYRYIRQRLEHLGRMDWVVQECDALCRAAAAQTSGPTQIRRLRGAGSLSASEMTVAEALLDVRDTLARELDRPPRTLLKDHLLVELARRGWTDPGRIRSLRGLNLSMAAVKRMAAAVETAKKSPAKDQPDLTVDADTPEEEVLLSLLSAVLRDFCHRNQLSYSLLAGKHELRQIVRRHTRNESDADGIGLLNGWRGKCVGDLVERILTGRCALRVGGIDEGCRLLLGD